MLHIPLSRQNGKQIINSKCRLALLLLLLGPGAAAAFAAPFGSRPAADLPPRQILADMGVRPIHVHDPSPVIQCGRRFWVFSTGWGIISYDSGNLKRWHPGPAVFRRRPAWVHRYVPRNRGFFWAPDVIYFRHRYWLYYAVSTFGSRISAIGLATNRTLNPGDPLFHWKDRGVVIASNRHTSFNAIDPSVIRAPGGKLWMSFGSFFSGIKLVQLSLRSGRLLHPHHPTVYSLAEHRTIEASELYHHGQWYYLFVNWGYCCRGVHSTYNIRVGRSRRITGPYLDLHGHNMLHSRGSLFLGTIGPFIGPGQAGIFDDHGRFYFTCHFYNGLRRGFSQLSVLPMTFSRSGWPKLIIHPRRKGASVN